MWIGGSASIGKAMLVEYERLKLIEERLVAVMGADETKCVPHGLCGHACMRACVRACVRACMRACVHALA